MSLTICRANYLQPEHAAAIPLLLNHYAMDAMGGGRPLPTELLDSVVKELSKRSYALSILAFDCGRAVGLINAFEGFSTFACRPLLNIHDIVVHRDSRGTGIAHRMLSALEQVARERGCCKMTLEVLARNVVAKSVYHSAGFAPYTLDDKSGDAEFWQKLF